MKYTSRVLRGRNKLYKEKQSIMRGTVESESEISIYRLKLLRIYDHEYRYEENGLHQSDFFIKMFSLENKTCITCKKTLTQEM